MILVLASIQFNLGGIIFYGIAFLEKEPTFHCPDLSGPECSRAEACDSGIYATDYQFYNLVE